MATARLRARSPELAIRETTYELTLNQKIVLAALYWRYKNGCRRRFVADRLSRQSVVAGRSLRIDCQTDIGAAEERAESAILALHEPMHVA